MQHLNISCSAPTCDPSVARLHVMTCPNVSCRLQGDALPEAVAAARGLGCALPQCLLFENWCAGPANAISPVSIKGPSWPATTATASCILVHCQCTAEHLAACCRGVQLRNDTHRMDTHCQRLCDNLAGPTSGPNTLFTTMPLYAGEHALRDGLYVDRESLCTMGYVARSTYAMRVSTTCLDNTYTNICTHQSASPLHRSLTHVSEVPTNADA